MGLWTLTDYFIYSKNYINPKIRTITQVCPLMSNYYSAATGS